LGLFKQGIKLFHNLLHAIDETMTKIMILHQENQKLESAKKAEAEIDHFSGGTI